MKWPHIVAAIMLLGGISRMALSRGQDHAVNPSAQERFIGAWRLVDLEEGDAAGNIHKADCTGLLDYTRDGHMSVQVMYQNPAPSSSAAPTHYAQSGYEASYGRYEVNDAHRFTFHVEGSLVRALIGKDLKRIYEFSSNELIVRSSDPSEHWRATWERY
jgi:hypothetical protein